MPANLMPPMEDYLRLLPEIILTFFGIVVMMLEAVTSGKRTYLGVISFRWELPPPSRPIFLVCLLRPARRFTIW